MSTSGREASCLDIHYFLHIQSKERFKAFVIHGPPLIGKTNLAQQLASRYPGGIYLDFLLHVTEHPELAQRVDTLDVANMQKIVMNYAAETEAKLLLVDELDFLVHTWAPDLTAFKHMISSLSATQTPTTIGFFVQTTPPLEAWFMLNTARQNRILHIEEIQAL